MMIKVTAVRDSDGKLIGETVFDVTDPEQRAAAVTDLVNTVYTAAPNPLDPPPFTLRFDKA